MFPGLLFLEIFDWRIRTNFDENSWVTRMINIYGKQKGVRKLAIDSFYLTEDFISKLMTLTELHLLVEHIQFQDTEEIEENLKLIPKGQIQKLCLSDTPWREYGKDLCINKFLKMLAGFQIPNIVLDRFYLTEDDDEADDNTEALGITSLYLEDNLKLKYQFFGTLPNLRFLTIYMNYSTFSNVKYHNKGNVYANKLRKYFIHANAEYVPNPVEMFQEYSIWDVLPKLEMLSVTVNTALEILDVQYFREYGNRPFLGHNMYVGRGRFILPSDAEDVLLEYLESSESGTE